MVEIECPACTKTIKPRQLNDTENYDTENYDGHVVCQECKSLLYVKLVKGKVQKSKVVENKNTNANRPINIIVSSEKAKELTENIGRRFLSEDEPKTEN